MEYAQRKLSLEQRLERLGSLAVGFSGGVDSAVLLHAATRVLGGRAVGVIADSPSLPRRELADARALAASMGARLVVVATREGDDPRYRANLGDRCYFCKDALFEAMSRSAARLGLAHLAFGEIVDDRFDDRPGRRAALERGVVAPLAEAGFRKADVRRYAAEAGLACADKPASACLASRVPVGTEVTPERLATIEAAEEALRPLGIELRRVRHRGGLARVEVAEGALERAEACRPLIQRLLTDLGFREVELAQYRPPGP